MRGLLATYPYVVAAVLVCLGVYAMIAHRNLLKKLIGLTILQTAVILFFLAISAKWDAGLPIVPGTGPVAPARFANPLPHALMLTAIVVMVATLGVALALLVEIYQRYGSFEEDAVLQGEER